MNKKLFCRDCNRPFPNLSTLKRHHKRKTTTCKLYKNVEHKCLLCGFSIKGLENIKDHMIKCRLRTCHDKEVHSLSSVTITNELASGACEQSSPPSFAWSPLPATELSPATERSSAASKARKLVDEQTGRRAELVSDGGRATKRNWQGQSNNTNFPTTLELMRTTTTQVQIVDSKSKEEQIKKSFQKLFSKQRKKIEKLETTINILTAILKSLDPKLEKFQVENNNITLFNLTSNSKLFLKQSCQEKIEILDEKKKMEDLEDIISFSSYRKSFKRAKIPLVSEPSLVERINKAKKIKLKRRQKCGRTREKIESFDLDKLLKESEEKEKEEIEKLKILCNDNIKQIKESRKYKKILKVLQSYRKKLLIFLGLKDFIKFLFYHIEQLEKVLKVKNKSDKTIKNYIGDGLSPLENRLIKYPRFIYKKIENGDTNFEQMEKILSVRSEFCLKYIPFELNCNIANYGLAMFPVMKLIYWKLLNPYGFYNIVYIEKPNILSKDPYSFYRLDEISKNRRYWTMDCRLACLTNELIESLQPYCEHLFKRLYYTVFNHNNYFEGYEKKLAGVELDCDQLARNIILLSQMQKLNLKLRELFKKNSTLKPTSFDYFNLFGDNPCQRKAFQIKEEVKMVDTIKKIFDKISDDEAVSFFKARDK